MSLGPTFKEAALAELQTILDVSEDNEENRAMIFEVIHFASYNQIRLVLKLLSMRFRPHAPVAELREVIRCECRVANEAVCEREVAMMERDEMEGMEDVIHAPGGDSSPATKDSTPSCYIPPGYKGSAPQFGPTSDQHQALGTSVHNLSRIRTWQPPVGSLLDRLGLTLIGLLWRIIMIALLGIEPKLLVPTKTLDPFAPKTPFQTVLFHLDSQDQLLNLDPHLLYTKIWNDTFKTLPFSVLLGIEPKLSVPTRTLEHNRIWILKGNSCWILFNRWLIVCRKTGLYSVLLGVEPKHLVPTRTLLRQILLAIRLIKREYKGDRKE
ncbi:hypothetical protein BSKO_02887 [Bryopsis sp. KO-2023]|nr:hypothetical protein BSKO_02887 [Bryopsis sp. KO-2023]